jgi:hypothetical protein
MSGAAASFAVSPARGHDLPARELSFVNRLHGLVAHAHEQE